MMPFWKTIYSFKHLKLKLIRSTPTDIEIFGLTFFLIIGQNLVN